MDHFRNVIVILIVLVLIGSTSPVKRCKQCKPCEPKVIHFMQCGQLPYTSKGKFLLDVHDYTAINATARLNCNIGFKLFGNPTIRCLPNLQWSFAFAICKEIVCKGVPTVDNGSFKVIGSSNVGDIAILVCRSGNVLTNGPVVHIQCQTNGMWSASKGTCKAVVCKGIPTVDNGSFKVIGSSNVGDIAILVCRSGHFLTNGPVVHIQCQTNGMWSASKGTCKAVDCNDLPIVKDGRFEITKGNGNFGSVAIFKCLDGASIPCDDTIACCGTDGEWTVTGTATCPTTLVSPTSVSVFFGKIDGGTKAEIIDTDINSCTDVSLNTVFPIQVSIFLPTGVVVNKVLIIGSIAVLDVIWQTNQCTPIVIENRQTCYQCSAGTSAQSIVDIFSSVSLQLCDVKIFTSQPCESK